MSVQEPRSCKLLKPDCSYSLRTNQALLVRTFHSLDLVLSILPGRQLQILSERQAWDPKTLTALEKLANSVKSILVLQRMAFDLPDEQTGRTAFHASAT